MAGDHEGGDVVGAARILIGSIFVLQRAIMAAVYSRLPVAGWKMERFRGRK